MARLEEIRGAGLGLKRELMPALQAGVPDCIDFFEIAPENWIGVGGRPRKQLDWFAERSGDERYASAGQAVQAAVESAVREKQVTRDLGGRLGTIEAGKAVAERLGGRVLASAGAAS